MNTQISLAAAFLMTTSTAFSQYCFPSARDCQAAVITGPAAADPIEKIAAYTPPEGMHWALESCQHIPCQLADNEPTKPSKAPVELQPTVEPPELKIKSADQAAKVIPDRAQQPAVAAENPRSLGAQFAETMTSLEGAPAVADVGTASSPETLTVSHSDVQKQVQGGYTYPPIDAAAQNSDKLIREFAGATTPTAREALASPTCANCRGNPQVLPNSTP